MATRTREGDAARGDLLTRIELELLAHDETRSRLADQMTRVTQEALAAESDEET